MPATANTTNDDAASEFWLYGYGSLIWKPPPHLIEGFRAGSMVMSGDSGRKVWGVAYRIVPEKVSEVKEYLDIREINGYSIHYTPFYPADGSTPMQTLVYIGTPDNEQFVGPQDPQKLAQHILNSKGPSGLNKDYLYGLDTALNELSPDSGDYHVSDLAQARSSTRALGQWNFVLDPNESELTIRTSSSSLSAIGIQGAY
ncbi:hypothetical protein J3459_004047 [Metarhizium acridum]|nr:hypothetical protein J3459_004047 [Metarhizium acridum]